MKKFLTSYNKSIISIKKHWLPLLMVFFFPLTLEAAPITYRFTAASVAGNYQSVTVDITADEASTTQSSAGAPSTPTNWTVSGLITLTGGETIPFTQADLSLIEVSFTGANWGSATFTDLAFATTANALTGSLSNTYGLSTWGAPVNTPFRTRDTATGVTNYFQLSASPTTVSAISASVGGFSWLYVSAFLLIGMMMVWHTRRKLS